MYHLKSKQEGHIWKSPIRLSGTMSRLGRDYLQVGYYTDSYFPDLDQEQDWVITADSEEQTYFDLEYTFLRYERKKK